MYDIKFKVVGEMEEDVETNDHGYKKTVKQMVKREREFFALVKGENSVDAISSLLRKNIPAGEIVNMHIHEVTKYVHIDGLMSPE